MKGLGSSGSQFSIPANSSQFTFSSDEIKKPPTTTNEGGKSGGKGDGKEGGEDGFFSREDIMKIQKAGFDQQNKIFQQSLAMGGIDKIAQGLYAGPQTYATKIVPQIFAGNAALLSAGAADNRSLAGVMSQPYRQLTRLNYYS